MGAPYLAAAHRTEVVPLRHVTGDDLMPVLEEETSTWRETLEWDFCPSAELVLRFVNMHSLSGYALMVGGKLAGYAYYLSEDRKGLIGDVYVAKEHRTQELENQLLAAVLEALREESVRRVESQLMMLAGPIDRPMPLANYLRVFRRTFMVWDGSGPELKEGNAGERLLLESWRDERHEEASQLIGMAYHGHIDSQINDQYQSIAGARRFLLNIVQYPGCGRFYQPSSYLAFHKDTGQPCGLILGSLVAENVGHITQVCVLPEMRGQGVGYELMRNSMHQLREYGCRKITLTVTSCNESAIRLYESMGFRRMREFAAHVWDGF
ncbi:MAG TPA: GNAT family N-acetyltransferase [Bryobacteraceae bacterium]|nr:GNAT family N-acetyltransferase [Bryobacteraceae bacterium]